MSFDAWVVGFGSSRVIADLALVESPMAYGVLGIVMAIDTCLLYRFFSRRASAQDAAAKECGLHPGGLRR
jgi:hypothetical protein